MSDNPKLYLVLDIRNCGYIRNVGLGNETTSVRYRASLFTESSVKPYTEGNFSKSGNFDVVEWNYDTMGNPNFAYLID